MRLNHQREIEVGIAASALRQRTDCFERIRRASTLEIGNVTREALLRRWLRSRTLCSALETNKDLCLCKECGAAYAVLKQTRTLPSGVHDQVRGDGWATGKQIIKVVLRIITAMEIPCPVTFLTPFLFQPCILYCCPEFLAWSSLRTFALAVPSA